METCASIRRARPLLGTFVEIAGSGPAQCDLQQAVDEAFDAVAQVHRLMSFHDAGSDVSRLNREAAARAVVVHPWTYQVLETALKLHDRSGGLFDVTVAPLLQDKGLLPRDPMSRDAPFEGVIGAGAIELRGGCAVRYRRPGIKIDLGGIAKGFAVDRAIDVLRGRVASGLVNAGGDLAAFGAQEQCVHIRNPKKPLELLCAVQIGDAALASSGRVTDMLDRAGAGETAVFDPKTRTSVCAIAGASVRAPSCMIADALTKIVMIAGEGAMQLLQDYQASALLVLETGEVLVTPDWQDGVGLAA
jgi:thiamine biosynthesis lipoprotein